MTGLGEAAWCARPWPHPADPDAAARLVDRVAPQGRAAEGLAGTAPGRAMLAAIGGNSPYLSDLSVREWRSLCAIAADGPEPVVADALATLTATDRASARPAVAATLRAAKRRIALATALADIGGAWNLARITAVLSDLAEAALRLAVGHALRQAHETGALRLPDPADPERGSGWVVLGMGKLGARELNYSSDVDLVLLHDGRAVPRAAEASDDGSTTALFTRLARSVVALMEVRDADGYVFRTDLRLRPDPAATPPSVAVETALVYYESMAVNWERAALMKARPIAGDLSLGDAFLADVRPFVWRRGLDFAAVADLAAVKRRIDAHKGTALADAPQSAARLLGHDVKLGQGGIREIEFVAQTLQLVWGGRDAGLRTPRTVEALRLLARARLLGTRAAGELASAYRFLRRVEHRVQMVADRQTHRLPESPAAFAALAVFMGFRDADAFARAALRHVDRVSRRYAEVFRDVPGGGGRDPLGDIENLGFAEVSAIRARLEEWRAGRPRAFRSERARELLDAVLPRVLAALGRQGEPDEAFRRLDRMISNLPAGVQPMSLFQRNPQLIDRVADVLGAAPSLAEHLANSPAALEGLLVPALPSDEDGLLARRLLDARDLQDVIAIVRRTVREEDFSISVATLEGRLDADRGGAARSALADATIRALLPAVLADMERRHGTVPGGGLAVVLLGKAGGREMMAGSDLDLMLVYDHPAEVVQSSGGLSSGGLSSGGLSSGGLSSGGRGRPLAPSEWFVRAVHGFVAALTAPDAGGALHAIDMRLRPSGNKGPVAVSLAAFAAYHAADGAAWTWERMALTRARVVAGPAALRTRVEQAIAAALQSAGSPERIRADAAAMRARMLRETPPPGPPYALAEAKLRPGGLIEVEFVAQALQLVYANRRCAPLSPNTAEALGRLRDAGALPAADADMLIRAGAAWRTVLGLLRLVHPRGAAGQPTGAAAEALLHAARAAGLAAVDAAALRASLDNVAAAVRTAFVRHVGALPAEEER